MLSSRIALLFACWVGRCPAQHLRRQRNILFITTAILILSAANAPNCTAAGRMIEDVPFFPQERYRCGPSALAGVLGYWGIKVSPEEIAAEIYSPSAGGTLDMDMLLYVQTKGLKADISKGSIEGLKRSIDSGTPTVVLVDTGIWVYKKQHYMVVLGYDDEGVTVNSGEDRHKHISYEDFGRTWKKGDYWTLHISR